MNTTRGGSPSAKSKTFISRAIDLYVDGFRNMGSTGRTLWVIILIKLFIMFFVLKLFFFPNILNRDYDNDAERAAAVRESLAQPR